jgi:malate dehydrogenase
MLDKIGVIGGGFIGGVLVQEIARRRLAREVGLSDPAPFVNPDDPPEQQETSRKQSVAKGKCLDVAEGLPTIRSDVRLVGSKDYSALAGADLIINTAGVPRKARPDGSFPTREELLTINLKVTSAVADGIKEQCPDAIVISVANPLDAIVYILPRTSSWGWPACWIPAGIVILSPKPPTYRWKTSTRWSSVGTETPWFRCAPRV